MGAAGFPVAFRGRNGHSSIADGERRAQAVIMRTRLVAAALALLAAGCASERPPPAKEAVITCPPGQSRATTAELVFGRNVGDRLAVSDDEWRRFIDEVVTPRFPDGLSVIDVQGQWRASNGQVVREPSKVLYLVLDGGPDDPKKISNIRQAYKQRFQQESVLLVTKAACVSF